MKSMHQAVPEDGTSNLRMAYDTKSRAARTCSDPLRRFLPTPYAAPLFVMGRTIHLETNSSTLLNHLVELFRPFPAVKGGSDFVWRIVVEAGAHCSPPWPRRTTFSDAGIRFAQFGQRNLIAVDIEARTAVAIVAEGLFDDLPGFTSPFIDTLFYMTCGALGLVPLAVACVCLGQEGLLILGPPNQGKTTASYLAAKDGVTFVADQCVFLEVVNGELRGWGDFVPIAFRPDALQHLPELKARTGLFSYCDFDFYYMAKDIPDSGTAGFVTPTCCIFLERGVSPVPRLTPLCEREFSELLPEHIAFKEESRFAEQQSQVLAKMAHLPAYHLAYGEDPATAAPFFRNLLTRHGKRLSVQSDGC